MNAGLSNFDTLKKHLVASGTLIGDTRFDKLVEDVGKGVAGMCEKYCNRKFTRVEGALFTCPADRDHTFVDRYPLEAVTKIEFKSDKNVGWEEQTGLVLNIDEVSGQVYWGAALSYSWAQMRFTFTGGYWFETAEPDDENYPSQMPAGATALPEDVKFAWLLQCRQVWTTLDKLGTDILTTGSSSQFVTGTLSTLELLPVVKQTLNQYRRLVLG